MNCQRQTDRSARIFFVSNDVNQSLRVGITKKSMLMNRTHLLINVSFFDRFGIGIENDEKRKKRKRLGRRTKFFLSDGFFFFFFSSLFNDRC